MASQLFAASGDPITSLGKKIASKAKLLEPDKFHLHDGHDGHDDIHDGKWFDSIKH